MKNLLDEFSLKNSSIVANSLMNRGRNCFGKNSYEKELSFPILDFLKFRSQTAWLDICCGQGNALIEAAAFFKKQDFKPNIIGVDLAGMFQDVPPESNFLQLIETTFENYKTDTNFDLITCVHGLHYIGDKLAFLQKAVAMLKTDGVFLANLAFANFKFTDGKSKITKILRKNGFEYDSKKHLLICKGKKKLQFDFKYLGADDGAGANYTKQAVVDSYYRQKI